MVGSDEEAAKRIGEICQEELKLHEDNPDMVQVLDTTAESTRKRGDCLNRRLQEIINPPALDKEEWKAVGAVFRVGDKVMQTKGT